MELIRGALWLAPFLAASAFAELPNSFEAGTPIIAAEVNQNFSSLDADIGAATNSVGELAEQVEGLRSDIVELDRDLNNLDSSSPLGVLLDANDQPMGTVLGADGFGLAVTFRASVEGPSGEVPVLLRALGPRSLGSHEDAPSTVFFESSDCTGPMYLDPRGESNGFIDGLSVAYGMLNAPSAYDLDPGVTELVLPAADTIRPVSLGSELRATLQPGDVGSEPGVVSECTEVFPGDITVDAFPAVSVGTLGEIFPPPYRYSTN